MTTHPSNVTSSLEPSRVRQLIHVYRDGLLSDTLPFWLDHCLDHQFGGYMTALDRDGTVVGTDKSVWFQGRFAWLLSTIYDQVEPRDEWLAAAKLGVDFLREFCFDTDGRMFFQVTREGRPLRKRCYAISETFTAIAYAAFAKASDDERAAREAADLFQKTARLMTEPGQLVPKVNPQTRPNRGFTVPMVLISTAQVLREALDNDRFTCWIDQGIDEIRRYFLNERLQAVMEQVGPDDELIDHYDGRSLNPGHAIEGAWFVLREAKHRGRNTQPVLLILVADLNVDF